MAEEANMLLNRAFMGLVRRADAEELEILDSLAHAGVVQCRVVGR